MPCEAVPLDVDVVTVQDSVCIRIHGEADISNHERLRIALAAVPVDGWAVVHLGLGNLRFCDVAAFRQLAHFAAKVRTAGGEVEVHDPSRMFLKLAAVMGADYRLHVR